VLDAATATASGLSRFERDRRSRPPRKPTARGDGAALTRAAALIEVGAAAAAARGISELT